VLPALVTGGVERGTVEIAAALARAGWRSLVASSGGPMVHEIERAGGKHFTLPLASKNPITMRRNAARLADLVRAETVDLIHARSRAPAWSAYWAASRLKIPFVTTMHSTYGGETGLKHRYNSVMSRGVRVIAISDFVAEHAMRVYGVGADRLRVIPRGVDLTRFDPDAIHASRLVALAREWRIEDGVPIVLLPGRLTRWKGHMELLAAVARLGSRDLQVILVGDDRQKPAYRRQIVEEVAALGLSGKVKMVGDCRDMPAAYMLADVVVSPSVEPEGFGRVAIEAQAMGRPTIASDHGGSRETVIPGETGWLTPPGDVEALALALAAALALGPAERLELGRRSRDNAASRFDHRRMEVSTLGVYTEILFPGAEGAGY
jgi:glycosyltransferase involved in cell wall biosynthesis